MREGSNFGAKSHLSPIDELGLEYKYPDHLDQGRLHRNRLGVGAVWRLTFHRQELKGRA
jgi:hypothetical protein